MDKLKKCPACAEEVQEAALKCRHCGSLLISTEWKQIVVKWRQLPESDRARYWEDLTSEDRETLRAVHEILPSNPPSMAGMAQNQAGAIICPNPNCLYQGAPKIVPRGSVVLGLILCLFLLLPGILYFILTSGNRYVCPRCGLQIRSDN
ncbi:MAG: hypothetical protein DRJ65_22335 [Acidobacteria bacterium]|nr:MAG: hypothetical protein DRJ65_22335 [Acidobacteriota bacterium]